MDNIEDKDIDEVYNTSTKVGEMIQKNCRTPTNALCTLMLTVGRLMAREGNSSMTIEEHWTSITELKEVFEEGFKAERQMGHKGVPG